MRKGSAGAAGRICIALVAVTHVLWCAVPASAQDSPGQNAVCTSTLNCSSTVGTSAFIDANVLFQNDICTTLYFILNGTNGQYSPGAVIDARGIKGATALTCPANTTPWLKGGVYLNKPATILLPATGAGNNFTPIVISKGWVLPANTHLFGQGDNIASGTVIQAASNLGNMIAFCSSPSCAGGIGVEKLVLDGKGNSVNGIVDSYAGSLSYVDHVSLYQILGTGLLISGSTATGSGPYSNINFDTGSATANSSTKCAQIIGTTETAGIRGLS